MGLLKPLQGHITHYNNSYIPLAMLVSQYIKNKMKLYATTTSERASKGQGGEWLEITITDKNKNQLWGIQIREEDGSYKMMTWNRIDGKLIENFIKKGEKQKGEKCRHCELYHMDGIYHDCPDNR